MRFYKYHGLGNDYIVLDPVYVGSNLSETQIRRICHRNYGVGSDGILFGPLETTECDFRLRIFNPDGSEAEKSGNGLRIFSRYLLDRGLVSKKTFSILTTGGKVQSTLNNDGNITVDMGNVSFYSDVIPVAGPKREVLNEEILIDGDKLSFCAVTVGNPHCVILRDPVLVEEAVNWGPIIETDLRFPNRINVQFMKILDRENIQIEIWERGAGYTLASGSSSSAAAAVAHKLGFCDRNITVHMPGGKLKIVIAENYSITMTGPVTKIAEGELASEMFEEDKS